MGWSLEAATIGGLFVSLLTWGFYKTFEPLLGFRWSIPSPIQWSLLVLFSSMRLYAKGVELFKAYYIALLAALGGGWLYEILYGIPHWVSTGFAHWNMFKLNANKVLYFEFQVISLPVVMYLLSRMNYKMHPLTIPALIACPLFYFTLPYTNMSLYRLGGKFSVLWLLRVPMVIFLWFLLEGVKNEFS